MTPTSAKPLRPARLCIGVVTGAHGIRGGVRIKSFTAAPEAVGAYGALADESGSRRFAIHVIGQQKGVVLAKLDGIDTRDAAEALKGLRLHVERDRLPPAEAEEYYHADLIGLEARLADGAPLGRVAAVWDFGAGVSLEIAAPAGGSVILPFTRATVPVVDLAGGFVAVDPPEGLLDKPEPPAALDAQQALAGELLGTGGDDA